MVVLLGTGIYSYWRFPTGPAAGNHLVGSATMAAPEQLKIAFFNIASGRGADGKVDLNRTIDQLRDFDFVGLAETRADLVGETQAQTIGQRLGMDYLFVPTEHTRFHDEFGNAVLSRFRIDQWQRTPLPGTQWSHHRNAAICMTTFNNEPLTLIVTHIDRTIDRAQQLGFLAKLIDAHPGQLVLMGDFNTRPDDPLLKPFRDRLTDAINLHLRPPNSDQVDWIFTRSVSVLDAGLTDHGASDHPLAWAVIGKKSE